MRPLPAPGRPWPEPSPGPPSDRAERFKERAEDAWRCEYLPVACKLRERADELTRAIRSHDVQRYRELTDELGDLLGRLERGERGPSYPGEED
jgi:hypothetical protein